ncbi:MAG: ATP-binding cassette domain-containing protein [Chloroflexi bacterium]|nr:ATP-binding cassette domain-containing protein [Chloroflexota bacterium]
MFRPRPISDSRSTPRPPPERPAPDQLRRLLAYLRPHRGRMVLALLALLVGTGLGLVFPLVIQLLVDTVIKSADRGLLNRLAGGLVLLFLVRAVFYYIQGFHLSYVGERMVVEIRRDLYGHLQTLGLRFYADRRVGEILSRLSSDVTAVRAALTNTVATALSQGLSFLGALAIMLGLRRTSLRLSDELAESTAMVEQALSAIRVVKAFGREPFEVRRYSSKLDDLFRTALKLTVWRSAFGALTTFLGFGAVTAMIWYGGREVIAGRLSAGQLVGFLVYAITIASALAAFSGLYSQVSEALGATRRLFEILDEQPEIADRPEAVPLGAVQGRITFEGVSFAYDSGREVLADLDLEVRPGEVLALVGPSGAGKSTIFNLIPRFFDPSAGQVRVDGRDLRTVQLASLRRQIGLVPQETELFSGTVGENLRYGRLEATAVEVMAAAQAANAWDFIGELPKGLDTLIGERGVKLSAGQRQRIAIARALLRDPRILLLDEATSSLDNQSESLVQQALERLMAGRTSLVIAHRLSTIYRADRIAVLDGGRLVELGSHTQLLAAGGLYARLHALQFRHLTDNEIY